MASDGGGSRRLARKEGITMKDMQLTGLVYSVLSASGRGGDDDEFLRDWREPLRRLEADSQPVSNDSIIVAGLTSAYSVCTDVCARPLLYLPDSTYAFLLVAERTPLYLWMTSLKSTYLGGQPGVSAFSYLERTNANYRRIGISKLAADTLLGEQLPYVVADALSTRFADADGLPPGGITFGGYIAGDNAASMARTGQPGEASLFFITGAHELLLLSPAPHSGQLDAEQSRPPTDRAAWQRPFEEAFGRSDYMLLPDELAAVLQHGRMAAVPECRDGHCRLACMLWDPRPFAKMVLLTDSGRQCDFVLLTNFIYNGGSGWEAVAPVATIDERRRALFCRLIEAVGRRADVGAAHLLLDFDKHSGAGWIELTRSLLASRLVGVEEEVYNLVQKDKSMLAAPPLVRTADNAASVPRFLDPRDHSTLLYFRAPPPPPARL